MACCGANKKGEFSPVLKSLLSQVKEIQSLILEERQTIHEKVTTAETETNKQKVRDAYFKRVDILNKKLSKLRVKIRDQRHKEIEANSEKGSK